MYFLGLLAIISTYCKLGRGGDCQYFKGYEDLGCFHNGEPWTSATRPVPPPNDPHFINTTIECYSRECPKKHTMTLWPDISTNGFKFCSEKPTVFICHGFIDSGDTPWLEAMKDNFLKARDATVCKVGWGKGSMGPNYLQACANVRVCGAELARFLRHLNSKEGIPYGKIHCIGHSLGGQCCGYAGKRTKGKIGRITALDCAQPLFEGYNHSVRLTKNDAKYVDAIHTNAVPCLGATGFGFMHPIGHADFYPNGGQRQSACEPVKLKFSSFLDMVAIPVEDFVNVGCSHGMAHKYMTASLNKNCSFRGYKVHWTHENLRDLESGIKGVYSNVTTCTKKTCSRMGLDAIKYGHGVFAVNTTDIPPYCDVKKDTTKEIEETDDLRTDSDSDQGSRLKSDSSSDLKTGAKTDSDSDLDKSADSGLNSESDKKTKSGSDSESDEKTKSNSDSKSHKKTKKGSDSDLSANSKPRPDKKTKPDSDPKSHEKTKKDSDPKSHEKTKKDSDSDFSANSKSEPDNKTKSDSDSKSHKKTKKDSKSDSSANSKPEPDSRSESD